MEDEDYALALQLQAEFAKETVVANETEYTFIPSRGQSPESLVDPYWELTDPNPDIRALFLQFNERFFWGRLAGIEVKWSPRMTLCAGLCCYEGRGGLCSVRLSVPLLKLRPRKDLVETLLHEMIHAYLFVTDNNKDHDGHGPEFHKHMYRINSEAGTNISVYHNFHDEVDAYRQHWWRCDGPCRSRKPYFGYVKRSMNRAPSKKDIWWEEHQRTCGGTYTKVKEPEDYGKKKNKKKEEEKKDKGKPPVKSMDIRIFGGQGKTLGNSSKNSNFPGISDKPPLPKLQTISDHSPRTSVSSFETSNQQDVTKGRNVLEGGSCGLVRNKDQFPLPGSKTPDKSSGIGPKNKPVSQGGVAKFKDKKKKILPVLDFSDSDDDDDLLIPVASSSTSGENMTEKNSPELEFSDDPWSMWSSDSDIEEICDISVSDIKGNTKVVIQDKEDISVIEKPKPRESQVENRDEVLIKERELENSDIKDDGEASDVQAMLRKVWGQKQFGTAPTKNRMQRGNPGVLWKSGNAGVLEKFGKSGDVAKKRTANDGDELSASGIAKKTKTDESAPMKISDSTKQEKPVDRLGFTSPLAKFFKTMNNQTSSKSPEIGQVERRVQNSVTDREQNSVADTSQDMTPCPVCSSLVLTSFINQHLDTCLTMQS